MRKLTGALAAEATAEATKVGHGASLQADSLLLILRRVDRCGERCGSREGGGSGVRVNEEDDDRVMWPLH